MLFSFSLSPPPVLTFVQPCPDFCYDRTYSGGCLANLKTLHIRLSVIYHLILVCVYFVQAFDNYISCLGIRVVTQNNKPCTQTPMVITLFVENALLADFGAMVPEQKSHITLLCRTATPCAPACDTCHRTLASPHSSTTCLASGLVLVAPVLMVGLSSTRSSSDAGWCTT